MIFFGKLSIDDECICFCSFFLGNPGDYAWGREGLDAIVTQLLNQMDVTGPPPLDKQKIREIPVTVIEQEQVGKSINLKRGDETPNNDSQILHIENSEKISRIKIF